MSVAVTPPAGPNRRTILSNILTLFLGNSAGQVLSILTLILTARLLGPDSYGQYVGTLTLCTFLSIVFSLGLDSWFLREVGAHPERMQKLLGTVLGVKLAVGGVWVAAVSVIAPWVDSQKFPAELLFLAAALVWLDDILLSLLSAFKAALKNRVTSAFTVAARSAWFAVTLALVMQGEVNPARYMTVRVFVSLGTVLIAGLAVWRAFRPRLDRQLIGRIRRETPAYALSEVLSMALMRLDVLIIAFLISETAVGLYSPAVSLTNTLYTVHAAIFAVMLPVLSSLFTRDVRQAWQTAKRMIWMQAGVGAALALGVGLGAPVLVTLLGPRYVASGPVLQILSVNIFIHSIGYALAIILIAVNQQARRSTVQAGVVAFNLVANLVMVQLAGIRGAAIVYVLTELLMMAGYALLVIRFAARNQPMPVCKHILLTNVHSIRNAGDAALSRVTLQQIRKNFPGCRVTAFMNDPDEPLSEDVTILGSFMTWIQPHGRWNYSRLVSFFPAVLIPVIAYRVVGSPLYALTPQALRSKIQAFLDTDLVISIPGGFFYSSGKGVTLLVIALTLGTAIIAGKPLYILPQSIGPLKRQWERWLARWVYNRARIVMVRESISMEELERCGVRAEKRRLAPDMAFAFEGRPAVEAQQWLRSIGVDPQSDRPLLGVTVIDWNAQSRNFAGQAGYEDAVAEAMASFIKQSHGKALLIPQCWGPVETEDDRIPARRVAARLSHLGPAVTVVEQPLSPELLKTVFGQMDMLVGTRMHSNIFALSQSTPVIAIGYLHKTQGIASMAGIQDWVVDIRQVSGEALAAKLADLWQQRQAVRTHLDRVIPGLVAESCRAVELVAADFYRRAGRVGHA